MPIKQHSPLITVALPIFNAGRFLRPAVLSVVQQTFSDWELLIIDDGSTDDSLESIQDIHDARIRIIADTNNKGLAARLNEAIDLAQGRYFARMDQDDISYPERFAQQLDRLISDPSLDLVGVRSIAISEDNEILGTFPYALTHDELCAKPWRGFYLMHPTWMGKTEWFRRHRYARPGPYLCEDQELLLRSYGTSHFSVIDDILFAYRVRGRVVWRKLLKTRWTVLVVQISHFVRDRKLSYLLFAVITFSARVIMDILHVIASMHSAPIVARYRGAPVDSLKTEKWRRVLRSVHPEPRIQF